MRLSGILDFIQGLVEGVVFLGGEVDGVDGDGGVFGVYGDDVVGEGLELFLQGKMLFQVAVGDDFADFGVAVDVFCQEDDVGFGGGVVDFGADDGFDADFQAGFVEGDGAGDGVEVGEGDGGLAGFFGEEGDFLGVEGGLEVGVVGVGVQVGEIFHLGKYSGKFGFIPKDVIIC